MMYEYGGQAHGTREVALPVVPGGMLGQFTDSLFAIPKADDMHGVWYSKINKHNAACWPHPSFMQTSWILRKWWWVTTWLCRQMLANPYRLLLI